MPNTSKPFVSSRIRATLAAGVLAVAAAVAGPPPAAAEPLNTCTAGKIKCTNAFATAVFKCFAAAYKKPPTFESQEKAKACVRKARQKFGTAVSPKPGCIEKVEAKQDLSKPETICPNGADEYDLDDVVKNFTEDIQDEIAPYGPSPVGSSCDGGKFKCVGASLKTLLACRETAFKKGTALDGGCTAKAYAKFGGGADPSKGCFAKLEAKQKFPKLKTLCANDGNTAVVGGKIDAFVAFIADAIVP